MSAAFDRFLAGRGPLARLISEQPRFDAPEGMFDRVLAAVDRPRGALAFEPPASLESAILAEAARLDAAQAPRREALFDQIASGATASDALGTPVSEPAQRWLDDQARARTASHTAARPATSRARWRRWFNGLGVAAAAALAASVALKVWFDPNAPAMAPTDMAPMTRSEVPAQAATQPAPEPAPPPGASNELGASLSAPRSAPADLARLAPRAFIAREADEAPPAPMAKQKAEVAARKPAAAPLEREAEQRRRMPESSQSLADEIAPRAESMRERKVAAPMFEALRAPAAPPAPAAEPPVAWDLPLATPADDIAARMQTVAPAHWLWVVSPEDAAHAAAQRDAVLARLEPTERTDTIRIDTAARPAGSLRITRRED